MKRVRAMFCAVACLLFGGPAFAQGDRAPRGVAGRFDYYILALSWSPSFCAIEGMANREPDQCGPGRRFAFIVHGLWPQMERGWPQFCAAGQRDVPAPLKRAMLDIMPSPGLVEHQWDRHGACTGLTQQAYFDLARRLNARIVKPREYAALTQPLATTGAAIEAAFVRANPGLTPAMISVQCNRNRVRDVRICFSKDGRLRACGPDVGDGCGQGRVVMPPAR